jgi:putative nucleotidyltransferase-like protein
VAEFSEILDTMKRAAAALQGADVPFALGGGLACWVRGGPETEHDVDFIVTPENAEPALEALANAGFRTERPPENWLYKAFDDDGTLIDVIFDPQGGPIHEDVLERAEDLEVAAVRMSVMTLEDVMVTKLLALREHEVDYDSVLEIARALREQIDWDDVRARTAESPYAKAFFVLAEELEIIPA